MKKLLVLAMFVVLTGILTGCVLPAAAVLPPAGNASAPATSTAAATVPATPLPSPTPIPTPSRIQVWVCTGYATGALNVRSCPGTECSILTTLEEGTFVAVGATFFSKEKGEWAFVSPGDGWVNMKYLCQK